MKGTFRWMGAAAILLTTANVGLWAFRTGFLAPQPFQNVENVTAEMIGDRVLINADFGKTDTDCNLVTLVVWGHLLGEREALDYEIERHPSQSQQRLPGRQNMQLIVDSRGGGWDAYEVQTRHRCGSMNVERTLLMVGAPS